MCQALWGDKDMISTLKEFILEQRKSHETKWWQYNVWQGTHATIGVHWRKNTWIYKMNQVLFRRRNDMSWKIKNKLKFATWKGRWWYIQAEGIIYARAARMYNIDLGKSSNWLRLGYRRRPLGRTISSSLRLN